MNHVNYNVYIMPIISCLSKPNSMPIMTSGGFLWLAKIAKLVYNSNNFGLWYL